VRRGPAGRLARETRRPADRDAAAPVGAAVRSRPSGSASWRASPASRLQVVPADGLEAVLAGRSSGCICSRLARGCIGEQISASALGNAVLPYRLLRAATCVRGIGILHR
jgi:hypothetical protein